MASPLLDIPGVRRGRVPDRRSGGRSGRRGSAAWAGPRASADGGLLGNRGAKLGWQRARRAALLLTVVVVTAGGWWTWRSTFVRVDLASGPGGLSMPSTALTSRELSFVVHPAGAAAHATVTIAGVEVGDVRHEHGRLLVHLPSVLPEAGYQLAVRVDRRFPLSATVSRWPLVIDDHPPSLTAPALTAPAAIRGPVALTGTVEPGAALHVEGGTEPPAVTVEEGTYRLDYPFAPAGPLVVVATDAAGNEARATFEVPVAYPLDSRAVHLSAAGWSDAPIRNQVLALLDTKAVNAVELDIKDEDGAIGYDSAVPMARDAGAVRAEYHIADAVRAVHERGGRLIGRIVAFRDPALATWAWANGHRDWVLQTPSGEMLSAYGGFTNYVRPEVRDYNLALAEEAVRAGFDDILWDYVRRPEGDPTDMVVPGLTGTATTTGQVITQFLAEGQQRLRPLGAYQGASVFGIAATRPENIGQPVPDIARHVDYVAPMVYPSHYVKGECGVADPVRQPYDIVRCSLGDFAKAMAGSGAALVPWLQDFTLGPVSYGAAQVRDEVRAARDAGATGFLLWNPDATYSSAALR